MDEPGPSGAMTAARAVTRWQLAFAAGAVLLAAADTYVVVVALPSIMTGVGLGIDHLERATPIVSGFLLGYVAMLPLLGRLSDLVGRTPVFVGCLLAFGSGSLLTATAHSLSVVVAGRAVQGLGGGGLVPVTLALVAERWPPETRGLPLGVVGAVQELGSVLGPLYGAAIVTAASWRTIFWINLPLSAALGIAFLAAGAGRQRATGGQQASGGQEAAGQRSAGQRSAGQRSAGQQSGMRSGSHGPGSDGRPDSVGAVLALGGAGLIGLGLWAPASLVDSVRWGGYWTPEVGGSAWVGLTTPVALAGVAALGAFVVWELAAPATFRRLCDLRRLPAVLAGADLPGAALLAGLLACVVISFSTADPTKQVTASSTPVLAPLAVVLAAAFVWRQRRARNPLLELGALRRRGAWGAMAVNLALGGALMAALVDVPFFARTTRYPHSQVGAALVLVRFLVAVPVGALAGGVLCRRRSWGPAVAAGGATVAALAFAAMSGWGTAALSTPLHVGGSSIGFGATDVELAVCGLGFGLAIAPVNAAVLDSVAPRLHGVASALVVVARSVGMLAGLSALTALGVRRFYEAQARIGTPLTLCPADPAHCPAYDRATNAALLQELHTVFAGAAVCAGIGAVLALALLGVRREASKAPAPASEAQTIP
ncbi:MFS transporter [Acidiferrimicrobium sp. IK]|uniref:MFS transporter n=1 Tax=Acidiferrimicrobium sp. IK TaxID=2871700 RepID=UPI0021CB6BF8|nr:MFS transporter [Acidiferrimicrobium sp. IK]MCU4185803.1 MFS transporter [Acidiferrimicrobium sp. IK]